MQTDRDELRAALEPFVKHWQTWMDETDEYGRLNWSDDIEMSTFARVTFGDLRRARAALARPEPERVEGLLPCPFCGGRAERLWDDDCFIACPKCRTYGPNGEDRTRGETEWNTRASLPADAATVAGEWRGPPYEYGVTWGPEAVCAANDMRTRIMRAIASYCRQMDEAGREALFSDLPYLIDALPAAPRAALNGGEG